MIRKYIYNRNLSGLFIEIEEVRKYRFYEDNMYATISYYKEELSTALSDVHNRNLVIL